MDITNLLSDEAILIEIGQRVARRRLNMQLTQAEVAEQAGVAKRTLERLEAGHSAQMSSLIRVLRVLGALEELDRLAADKVARVVRLGGFINSAPGCCRKAGHGRWSCCGIRARPANGHRNGVRGRTATDRGPGMTTHDDRCRGPFMGPNDRRRVAR